MTWCPNIHDRGLCEVHKNYLSIGNGGQGLCFVHSSTLKIEAA